MTSRRVSTRGDQRFRPASQWSPLTSELDSIFGPVVKAMLERHVADAGARAAELLTDAERAALARHGLGRP